MSMTIKQLGIEHVRVDERLIHGQVATLWIGNLGVNRVIVVDDDVVSDEITKSSLKMAVPNGIKLSILRTKTAVERILDGRYSEQKVMIIVKKLSTIFDLIDGGVPISSFNLGNVSKKDNTKSVTKSVFLSQNEIDRILDLEKKGVLVTAQMVPMEEAVSFSDFYGKDE